MINTFEQINWKPNDDEIKAFAKTLFIGSLVVSVVFFIYTLSSSTLTEALYLPLYIIIAGGMIILFSDINPGLLIPLYYVWYLIGAFIGGIVSNLLLILFYYLIFAPFSQVLKRLTKRDPLRIKKIDDSNWIDVKKVNNMKRYFKQY